MVKVRARVHGQSWWGINGEAAAAIIEKDNPKVEATDAEEGMFMTADVRSDRVRVWVDENGIVEDVPEIG